MIRYLFFIILGILLFLLLNHTNRFSIGNQHVGLGDEFIKGITMETMCEVLPYCGHIPPGHTNPWWPCTSCALYKYFQMWMNLDFNDEDEDFLDQLLIEYDTKHYKERVSRMEFRIQLMLIYTAINNRKKIFPSDYNMNIVIRTIFYKGKVLQLTTELKSNGEDIEPSIRYIFETVLDNGQAIMMSITHRIENKEEKEDISHMFIFYKGEDSSYNYIGGGENNFSSTNITKFILKLTGVNLKPDESRSKRKYYKNILSLRYFTIISDSITTRTNVNNIIIEPNSMYPPILQVNTFPREAFTPNFESKSGKQIKIDYPIGVRFKSIELYDPLKSTPDPIPAERSQPGLITDIGILESIRDEMEEEYSIRSIHELYDSYFRDNESISDELHHDLQSNPDKTIQDMINALNSHLI